MKIGTTTFGFRYAFLNPELSPALADIIRQSRELGIERLQVCENSRPLEISKAGWQEAMRCASELGVEIQLGCKTLKADVVERYLLLAQDIGCAQLRIVMEEHDEHANRENATRLIEQIVPRIQRLGMRLALENHFDISSTLLVELASVYPPEAVGFCVDTANSLRSFESAGDVLKLLQNRAYCYHLKDYRVVGSMISFSVIGAPLGEGDLPLNDALKTIFAQPPVPPLFVETWVPSENTRQRDMVVEIDWLKRSVKNLRARLEKLQLA